MTAEFILWGAQGAITLILMGAGFAARRILDQVGQLSAAAAADRHAAAMERAALAERLARVETSLSAVSEMADDLRRLTAMVAELRESLARLSALSDAAARVGLRSRAE